MTIRAKDIPDDTFDAMREGWRWPGNANMTKGYLAYVLQLAIENGLGSPPCRILRSQWGSLQSDAIYIDDDAAQSAASPGDSSEHWKGQTE